MVSLAGLGAAILLVSASQTAPAGSHPTSSSAARERAAVSQLRAAHCRPIPAEPARARVHGGSPASLWFAAQGDTDHPVVGIDQSTDSLTGR